MRPVQPCNEALRANGESFLNGQQESTIWSHKDTLSVMELMDKVRHANSLHYGSLEST